MNKPTFSVYVSFALKVVGTIVIVSSIIDYIILAVPFQPLDPNGLIFSSVMGLIFFLLVPLYLSNLSLVRGKAIAQIEQRFVSEEQQIQHQIQQIRQVIESLEELLDINPSRQMTGLRLERLKQLRNQIEQFRNNPDLLDKQYNEAITELRDRRQEAENQTKTNIRKSGFRIGINCLLLAIGYIIIGWTGLRGLAGGGSLPLSRQVRAR